MAGVDATVLAVAVVGGVVGAGLLLAVLVLVVCVCLRRWHSGHVNLSKQGKKGRGDVELGHIRPHVEPQIGSDQYRALCPYHPQQSGTGKVVSTVTTARGDISDDKMIVMFQMTCHWRRGNG